MTHERIESKIKYVSLHNHSGASSYDGFGSPETHLDFAFSNGLDAHVFTEHGHMNSMSQAFIHNKRMNKEGRNFKQIYGIEAYFIESQDNWRQLKEDSDKAKQSKDKKSDLIIVDSNEEQSFEVEEETKSDKKRNPLNIRSHLILLAKNEIGLKNLFKITSESHIGDRFYRYPRVDYELLKQNSEGIIASSACIGGQLGMCYWLNKDKGLDFVYDKMLEVASNFRSIFKQDYYLELQWNAIEEQHIINQLIIRLSKELNIELISTCDAHYPNPESWLDREVYKRLKFLGNKNSDNKLPTHISEMKYELYPKNGDQMWESYKRYSKELEMSYDNDLIMESFERTNEIAFNKIENYKIDVSPKLPSFALEEGKDAATELRTLVFDSLKERNITDKRYIDQIEYELSVINKRNFAKYFLTTKQITDFTKDYSLPSNGRGCFLPGNLVKLSDQSLKNIENIKIGDIVISHQKNHKKVLNTFKYSIDEEIIEIIMTDGRIISCTQDHEIYTSLGWKRAKDLTENDEIISV